jgi:hypothetical protein
MSTAMIIIVLNDKSTEYGALLQWDLRRWHSDLHITYTEWPRFEPQSPRREVGDWSPQQETVQANG